MSEFSEVAATPKNFWSTLGRMSKVLWRPALAKWRPRMIVAVVITLASKGFAVAAPVFLGDGINRVVDGESVAAATPSFVMFFLMFAAARFLSNGLPQARDAFFTRVTQDANRVIAVEAFAHAQAQSLQFHLTRRAGAISRIIERGAGAMEFLLRFLAFNIGPTAIELALAAGVMAALYSWTLGLAAIATVVIYAVFTVIVTEWRNQQRRAMNEADTELRAITMDTLTNFETVKAFAAEERETARYDQAMQAYNNRFVRQAQSLALLNAGQELIMTAGLLAAALLSAAAVGDGRLKPGDITAVILMLTNIYRPLNILGFAWREIKQGAVDIEKLFDLFDLKPEVADKPDARELSPTRGSIRFEKVSFTHQGRQAGLNGVDFEILGGSFVGIVGPSGAGKSTILKLLFRFYDPSAGRILIDGVDIRDVTQMSLRAALGLVPQEVVLFNDTLRFNLTYARPGASEAEILDAARRAQLGPFIDSLPNGLATKVGERGLKLSGGEKQRVGVARAILLDPAILVLDEATSSLDFRNGKGRSGRARRSLARAHDHRGRASIVDDCARRYDLRAGRRRHHRTGRTRGLAREKRALCGALAPADGRRGRQGRGASRSNDN